MFYMQYTMILMDKVLDLYSCTCFVLYGINADIHVPKGFFVCRIHVR